MRKFTPFGKNKRWLSIGLAVAMILTALFTPIGDLPAEASTNALGDVLSSSVNGDTLTLVIDNGTEPDDDILEIEVLDEDILKVNYRPQGEEPSPDTPMLDSDRVWEPVGAAIDTSGDPITIVTSKMKIEISVSPARMTVKKSDGTTLLWEPASGGVFYDGVRFEHSPDHHVYGIRSYAFNEDGDDIIRDQSSHAAHAGEQGDAGGPFIWSTAGYGVLIDSDGGYPYTEKSTGKLEFYYGGDPPEGRRYAKNDVEYYVMLGTPKELMNSFSKITGKAPLLPKWSLGFSNFEWGSDQTEVMNMVDTYRAKNIPLDSFGLDYDWKRYGDDNYGEFQWNTDRFPDAATISLKQQMDAQGVKMIGITKPRIVTIDRTGQRTEQYQDAEAGGYWYPGHSEYQDYFIPVTVRSIDAYSDAVRSWLWNHSQDAFQKGIVGWWNDETDKVSSGGVQYWFGNFMTTHLSQAMYEGQREFTSDSTRVWQTARTFYPGAQRYATTLWSGDIGIQFYKGEKIEWARGMQEQRSSMLSSINLGQPKWGMDIGGFNKADGTTDNPSPELYTRWMQFGAFTPVFRVHGNYEQQRQPWYYGNTAEEVSKSVIQLRYSLLPYMYAYERTAYEQGVGLVRPLLFDYPSDPNVSNLIDSWMFGDWLLVSPVVEEQQKSKEIYLPEGTWIDYFRGTVYDGGQTIHYPLNAESWTDIPLFIKKGAIIPTQDVQDYVGQVEATTIEVDVFPDTETSSFMLYDDDGISYHYEDGEYFKQQLSVQDSGTTGIYFTVGEREGNYMPKVEYYLVKIHGKAGSSVHIEGRSATQYDDLSTLKEAAGEGWSYGKDIYGDVTYVKVAAGSTLPRTIVVSGSTSPSSDVMKYEAEEASRSGNTVEDKATVNTDHNGFSGTGFVDGFHNEGAAVTFYADVAVAGDYNVNLRYANASGTDQVISIYVNGKRIKGTHLSQTANWDTWADQAEMIPLQAGRNIITYKYDGEAGDTGNVNLDYVTVPFEPQFSKYEAENQRLSGGAKATQDHWFYSGSAFVDGFTSVGAQTEFTIQVPEDGSYRLALRYANGTGSEQTISTFVNGTKLTQNSLPSPGMNWNQWQDYVQTVSLQKGLNTVAFKYDVGDSGNINLDRLLVSSAVVTDPVSEQNLLDNGGFERGTQDSSNWTEWHPSSQTSAYGIDSGSTTNPPESAWTGNQRAYFWSSSAYQQSIHQVVDVPINQAHYKFEARVRLKNTEPSVARAEISGYGGDTIYYNISNNGDWQYILIDSIYVTNGEIDVGFYVDSPGGTTLHIDDVRLTLQQ